MKNTDYLIYLTTRRGGVTRFDRDRKGWVQKAPSGTSRRCSAEQVLNHLLSALVLGESVIATSVRLKRGRHFRPLVGHLRTSKSGEEE